LGVARKLHAERADYCTRYDGRPEVTLHVYPFSSTSSVAALRNVGSQ